MLFKQPEILHLIPGCNTENTSEVKVNLMWFNHPLVKVVSRFFFQQLALTMAKGIAKNSSGGRGPIWRKGCAFPPLFGLGIVLSWGGCVDIVTGRGDRGRTEPSLGTSCSLSRSDIGAMDFRVLSYRPPSRLGLSIYYIFWEVAYPFFFLHSFGCLSRYHRQTWHEISQSGIHARFQ